MKQFIQINHTKHFLIIFAMFLIVFSQIGFDFVQISSSDSKLIDVAINIGNCIYYLNSFSFIAIIFLIFMRFKSCNEFLAVVLTSKNTEKIFKCFQSLQLELFEIILLTNETFGLQIMFAVFMIFIYGIFASFTVFEAFLRKNENFKGMIVETVPLVLYDYCNFIIICTFSTLILREIDKSMKISRKIISKNKKIVNLECLIEENSINFNCGLFEFDWKLLATVS
jgi:hypothetical protein